MIVTWGVTGTYTITERNMPDFPISEKELDGGDYRRNLSGVVYNPSRWKIKEYSFNFSGVEPAVLDIFANIFKNESDFTITDVNFGTIQMLPVPGSLSTAYLTKNNCNMSFVAQTKEAI